MRNSDWRDRLVADCTDADRTVARADNLREIENTILARRATLLPSAQRTVILLWLTGAHSLRSLGTVLGVNAGTLCRRISRWLRRLRHPVVAAIADFGADLPPAYRRVGLDRFLHGMSLRRLGDVHCLGGREVQSVLAYLKAWATLRRQMETGAGREQAEDETD